MELTTLENDSNFDFNLLSSKLPNIRHLDLCLAFNNNIKLIIPSFNHLTSLKISAIPPSNNSICSLLQMLLDRAPHLYSLSLYQVLFHKSTIHKLTSTSIRRLELTSIFSTDRGFLSTVECCNLIKSPLGRQCEVLMLRVKHRSDILQLVKKMFNLRSLIVQCKDDVRVCGRSIFSTHGELLKWLQRRLPSVYSITRDVNATNNIRLWIR